MLSWGLIVFIGLWLILRDTHIVTKAKLIGQPILIHIVIIVGRHRRCFFNNNYRFLQSNIPVRQHVAHIIQGGRIVRIDG